jgi:hypothetical protein
MPQDFGNGVSRTLSAVGRQFETVVWQADKPPLDSELNLMSQVDTERVANAVRTAMHSGFLADPLVADTDFVVDPAHSNRFFLGRQATGEQAPILWANVNGWLVPVTGTLVPDGNTSNQVNLFPPPSSDTRIDLVFLEVWLAQVAPNPSTLNKPSATTLYKYGNTLFGGTNFPDDLEDPTVGFETTERVQVQYRLRVYGSGSGLGASVDLSRYPDGLGDPNVLGRGAAVSPVGGFPFANMREELGDPSLWRAGDGDATNALGTVDGYTYAVPVCAVFRRNTQPFTAISTSGGENQNGSFDRNPLSVPVVNPADGATTFGTLTFTAALSETTTGVVAVTGLTGSGFDNPNLNWSNTFIVVDDEIIGLDSVNVAGNTVTISAGGRGRWGTQAAPHDAGATVRFFNWRMGGLFADQVAAQDILDLRRTVTPGEWDYHQLLVSNLSRLFRNQLRTSYKQSGVTGGDVEGVVVPEVDSLYSGGVAPDQTDALDGFDGIRTVFSDAAVAQADVTVLLDPPAGPGAVASFASGSAWEVAADFVPDGFGTVAGWSNGTILNLYIGGANGNSGARRTVLSAGANRIVRFLTPAEMWLSRDNDPLKGRQAPVTLRFLGSNATPSAGAATEPAAGTEAQAAHPGPVYPLPEHNFERPFIVLGGVVNNTLLVAGTAEALSSTTTTSTLPEVKLTGVNFDTPGVFFPTAGVAVNDPAACAQPLLYGTRTLYDMLTAGGTDLSGKSSEVYLVLSGDVTDPTITNGVFRVIGAGTVGYTTNSASAADQVAVEFIREVGGPSDFVAPGPTTGLTAEVRSQYTHTLDDNGSVAGPSALTIVLTDLNGTTGGATNPWAGLLPTPVDSLLAVNTTLQYGPSRGGTSRVPDVVQRFAVVNPSTTDTFVRNTPSEFDPTFPTVTGVPDNEAYFPPQPVQTWNRLSSLGLNAPMAPAYGGLRAAFTEQDREAELFVDKGSKTVMFRPLVKREMTVVKRTLTSGTLIPAVYPNSHSVDPQGFFTAAPQGFPLPPEYMPRFGRQDIPCHLVDPLAPSAGSFLFGFNHLFADTVTNTDTVFNILVGGSATTSNPSMFVQTDPASTLDYGDYGAIPGGLSGYQGRLFADVNIVSSEGGQGMKGIQLPPFLGVARVYAVYDAREWNGVSAFAADRVTPNPAGATNLLRTDVDKQTLYFLQGGAADFTGNTDDHTYIVPENVVDIRRSSAYTAGETFSDLHYVVEFMAFGFARGFVNKNTYVLARDTVPSSTTGPLLPDLQMVVNAAAKYPTQAYVGYARTVYQGDPYMTRSGSVRTTVDYQTRYGQVPVASAYEADTPIQQYTLTGAQIPETPNVRALEVLAAVDFYTTLGTGKVGGRVYAGTPLDVGTLAPTGSRVPASPTAPAAQSVPRVFTAGQAPEAPHAHLMVSVTNNVLVNAGDVLTLTRGAATVSFTGGVDFSGGSATATAEALALAINGNATAQNLIRVYAEAMGQVVNLVSVDAGSVGNDIQVSLTPRSGLAFYGVPLAPRTSQTHLQGGVDVPTNGAANYYAATPAELTGLTERLPLGILLQDSDFVGEDPLHDGTSLLAARVDAVNLAANFQAPMLGQQEYDRMVGGTGSFVALADGSILEYTPYNAISTPTGARSFRLFRGGGSAYVIGTGTAPGGPVEFSAGSFPESQAPVLKGAVLVGKALLVRNYHEEAFAISDTTTEGDELQMVVLTQAIVGNGAPCRYTLSGEISPTGYGEGYAAADRYRLVGKPMHHGHSRVAPPTDVPLAPYPSVDPNEPDPCA